MADIELVIKIPEYIVEGAKSSPNYYPAYCFEKIWRAIVKGTPLPKRHGRLIDADALKPYDCDYDNGYGCDKICYCDNCTYQIVKASKIDNAPTVIEADKEEINA